jgi:hypothetical protein
MKTELDLDPGLNPNPDPTLITDSNRDPNLQIMSDPAESCFLVFKNFSNLASNSRRYSHSSQYFF